MSEEKVIPKHWQYKKLGEVCDKITKGGTPTTYGFAFVSSGINFIKVENIEHGKVNLSSIRTFITDEAHNYQKKSILEENDLLFSIAGTIGETCLIKQEYLPANTNQALAILRGYYKEVQPQFLTYQLSSSISQYVKSKARGGAMNNISLEDLKGIDLVVPPLPEQRAIVAKIEELLSDLENGKQQLQTAQQQLKVYRQSLLKWAFEGLKEEKTIEEISEDHSIGLVRSSKDQNDIQKGVPYIKMNNVDLDGNVDFKKVVYVEVIPEEAKKYSLKKGDILINTRNSIELVGKTGVVREEKPNCVFNNNLLRIRTKQEYNSLFIGYQLIGPWLRKQMTREKKSTTNVCALYQRDIFPLKIKVANSKEQQLIVDELESKLTICDKLEETISHSLQQAETLRQSILKKAFEGKLVTQNPNDELASKLLEKIKAESAEAR